MHASQTTHITSTNVDSVDHSIRHCSFKTPHVVWNPGNSAQSSDSLLNTPITEARGSHRHSNGVVRAT